MLVGTVDLTTERRDDRRELPGGDWPEAKSLRVLHLPRHVGWPGLVERGYPVVIHGAREAKHAADIVFAVEHNTRFIELSVHEAEVEVDLHRRPSVRGGARSWPPRKSSFPQVSY